MSQPAADRSTLPSWRTSVRIVLVFAAIGAILGLSVRGDRHMWGDAALLKAIQRVDLPGTVALVDLSNVLFHTFGALALAGVFVAMALAMRRRLFVLQLATVILLRLVSQLLKSAFASPRPGVEYQPDPSAVSTTYGYPSGHAATATVVAIMFVLFVYALDVPRWARWTAIAAALGVISLAMFARIHVGAHWPSDTIGGVLFGVATVALMQVIVGRLVAPGGILGRRGYRHGFVTMR